MNTLAWDKRIKEANNLRDAVWCTGVFVQYEQEVARILALYKDKKVLEIGSGWGRMCEYFEPENYTGVDFSKGMVGEAKKRYPDYNFIHADIKEKTFEGYDVVFEVISLGSLGMTEADFIKMFSHIPTVIMFQAEGVRICNNFKKRDTDEQMAIYDFLHSKLRFEKATDQQLLTTFMRQLESETEYFGRHRGEDPCVFRETEHGWFLYDGDGVVGYGFFEELRDGVASAGWAILDKYRGKSIGQKFGKKIFYEARRFGIKTIEAHVEKTNWMAIASDLNIGFKVVKEDDELVELKKTL